MLFGPKYSPTPTATERRSSSTTSNTAVAEVSGQEQSARKRGIRYRAFGKRFTLSGSNPARRDPSFQNRTYDAGLGIYDYRNRSFDPSTGRFLQRDPVLGGDSLYNPYVFPGNNPVGNVDPMGLGEWKRVAEGVWKWKGKNEKDVPKKDDKGKWKLPEGAKESIGPETGDPPSYAYTDDAKLMTYFRKEYDKQERKWLAALSRERTAPAGATQPKMSSPGTSKVVTNTDNPHLCPGGLTLTYTVIKLESDEKAVKLLAEYTGMKQYRWQYSGSWGIKKARTYERFVPDRANPEAMKRQVMTVDAIVVNSLVRVPPFKDLSDKEMEGLGPAWSNYPRVKPRKRQRPFKRRDSKWKDLFKWGKPLKNPINPLVFKKQRAFSKANTISMTVAERMRLHNERIRVERQGALWVPYRLVSDWRDAVPPPAPPPADPEPE